MFGRRPDLIEEVAGSGELLLTPVEFGKYDDWRIILTKTPKTTGKLSVTPGTTICVEARAHSGGATSPWSASECTATPVDDRTLDEQPPSAWGDFHFSDCYRGTYTGNGGGTYIVWLFNRNAGPVLVQFRAR